MARAHFPIVEADGAGYCGGDEQCCPEPPSLAHGLGAARRRLPIGRIAAGDSVAAARDRCVRAWPSSGAAADTFARAPARNQDVGSRPPALAGRRGDLPTKRDASRRPPPRIVQICRQSKDLQSDAAPKRARGTPVDAAGGLTSPPQRPLDSCAAAGPAEAQTGCPPCARQQHQCIALSRSDSAPTP